MNFQLESYVVVQRTKVTPKLFACPIEKCVCTTHPNVINGFVVRQQIQGFQHAMEPYHAISPQFEQQLKRWCDPFTEIKRMIEQTYHAQCVTNAWLKCYEMLTKMNVLPLSECLGRAQPTLRVFFNAEMPGAFICATQHYLQTHAPNVVMDWVASSLIEDIEAPIKQCEHTEQAPSMLGDQYGIHHHNPDRWLMGTTHNGDVTCADTLCKIRDQIYLRFPDGVDMYTSDAGMDVSDNFDQQEETTALLNFGQVVSGLMCLRRGGVCLIKQFTFFTPWSLSLLEWVSGLFDSVVLVKPTTSRPANSEIYWIGNGFHGITKEVETALLQRMRECKTSPMPSMALLSLPIIRGSTDCITTICAIGSHIGQRQSQALSQRLQLYEWYKNAPNEMKQWAKQQSTTIRGEFINQHPMTILSHHIPSFSSSSRYTNKNKNKPRPFYVSNNTVSNSTVSPQEEPRSTLRQFHNWIKSTALHQAIQQVRQTHSNDKLTLLDIGCGAGGDMHKWKQSGISTIVGVDRNKDAIIEAISRLHQSKYHGVWFFTLDATHPEFQRKLSRLVSQPMDGHFHLISCQFALQYFYKNAYTLKHVLRIIASRMVSGGVFFGTVAEGGRVRKLIGTESERTNDVYSVRVNGKAQPLGQSCQFYLGKTRYFDTESNEYCVDLSTLKQFCESVGLTWVETRGFIDWWKEWKGKKPFASQDEEDISFTNTSFVFIKK